MANFATKRPGIPATPCGMNNSGNVGNYCACQQREGRKREGKGKFESSKNTTN